MPVRKSDLLRAGCASKPRLHGRTKNPSAAPRICAMHDAKSGGRKAGGGTACPRGRGGTAPLDKQIQTGIWSQPDMTRPPEGKFPTRKVPGGWEEQISHLRWVSPPEQHQGSSQKPWTLNHYFVIYVKNSFQKQGPYKPNRHSGASEPNSE